MDPATNAGAAHPIVDGRQLDPVLKEKIENDAAAFLRSYAGRRGRNVQAAEHAIRNSKSYSDEEALKLNLIDLVALDDAALLIALDNREIHRFDGSTQTLHLKQAAIITAAPSLRERLLSKLTNPDIAVLLMVLGGLLIYLEFNVPEAMIGATAIVRTPLNPTGQVEIRGELWQASLRGQTSLPVGSAVYVRGIEGLVLIVEPVQDTV